MVKGKLVQCQLADLDLLAGPETKHADSSVNGEGGGSQPFGVMDMERATTSFEECLAVCRVPRLTLGSAEADGQIDLHDGVGFVDLGDDLECLRVIT